MVVVSRTTGIVKNDLNAFERGEHLLQNGTLHFVLSKANCQESPWNIRN